MGTVATPVQVNGGTTNETIVIASNKGDWATAHLSASATAQTAAELIRPGSVSSANVQPLLLGAGVTRVLVRCRYSAAGTVTTLPVVRLIGVYGKGIINGTSIPDDGTAKFVILASAQTVTCVPATDVRDTTYSYSAPLSLSGTDLLGANYLMVFIETAASISGAVDEIIEVLLIN